MKIRTILTLSAFLLGSLVWGQSFDPTSVKPKGCDDTKYNCGLRFASQDQREAVPESASSGIRHRGLPSKYDLAPQMPPIGSQGRQGSCVAWATTYAVKSYHEKRKKKWSYDPPFRGGKGNHVFSPAYVYNQINGGRDQGSFIHDAFALLVKQGAAPWRLMPYNQRDFRKQPSSRARREARKYRAQSYKRISYKNLSAIKSEIVKGNPLVFGMPVDDAWYRLKRGVYDRGGGKNYGGHAMALVGFDDKKKSRRGHRGAFKILNSWGRSWGDKGYGWISYRRWLQLRPYTYVLYDSDKPSPQQTEFKAPSYVRATQGTYSNKVVVSWGRVNDAAAYGVYRKVPKSDEYSYIGYANNNVYDDKSIQKDLSYKYKVVAYKGQKQTSLADSPIAQGHAGGAGVTRPGKVQNLAASTSGRRVTLSWDGLPEASKYRVLRWDSRRKRWRNKGFARKNTYTDRRPVRNARNVYAVRGVNKKGYGKWSNTVEIVLKQSTTTPTKVSGLYATQGTHKDKIVVSWKKQPAATTYYIFRYDVSSKQWHGPKTTSSNSLTDTDSSVKNGNWFGYTVVAANSAGQSGYAEPVIGRTNPNVQRAGMVPEPPKGVASKINKKKGTVTISWKRDRNAFQYYVFRKEKGSDDYKFIKSLNAKKRSYTEKIPEQGKLYFYVVKSKTELGGESESSKEVAAFINEPQISVAHRFVKGDGIKNFVGKWKGMYWQPSGRPVVVDIDISAKGDKFQVNLKSNLGKKKRFKGQYVTGSQSINAKKFNLDIIEVEGEDIAEVELDAGAIDRNRIKVVMTKAGKE